MKIIKDLDTKLFTRCKVAHVTNLTELNNLYRDLIEMCENEYKSHIFRDMKKTKVKLILDETFESWDSFARMCLKEEGFLHLFGEYCQLNTFKKLLLSDKKMAMLYESLPTDTTLY
jgi:hypothetical protein